MDSNRRSVDGILAGPPEKPASAPTPRRPRPVRPPKGEPAHQPVSFWKKTLHALGQATLFVLLLAAGLLIQSPLIGQGAVFLYGIAAFIWHIESRTTFLLVLGCFMMVLVASARSDTTLASTFAAYAFFLLIIGTISLAFEVRNEI